MDRLTSKQLKQLLDFLRAGYACHEQEAFITHLLGWLSTLIPGEITSYTELNPPERRCRLWLVEPSDAATSEDQRIFEVYAPEQPLIASYLRTQNGGARKNSDFLTQRQFHQTALYNEFYRRVGMEHTIAIHLGAPSLIIGIALHRALTDFSERDRPLLDLLRPHLAQAYANAQALSAMRQEVGFVQHGLEVSGQEMVILTKEGRVRLMTPRAQDWLAAYFGPIRTEQLPETLETWRTHQEAALDRADDVPPPREPLRVQRDGTCLLVRHLCEADHCLLLLEERQTGLQSVSFQHNGLTRREAEVLQWVTQGKTNAEIGIILGMSPATVKKHLQHVYEKLGVETRTATATLALGWRSGVYA